MNAAIPDTFWTTSEELALFGGSLLVGIPAGVLLDLLRLFRRIIPHPVLAVAVEDILWLLETALLLLLYASACARGVFRVYYAAGCLIGLILYELTLGEPTVRLLDQIRRIIAVPFRWIGQRILSICTKISCDFRRIHQKCKGGKEIPQKHLQADQHWVYNNKRCKKKG